jgi:CRISPR/Cas system-associated exonuclease Cas4 (RecB family)
VTLLGLFPIRGAVDLVERRAGASGKDALRVTDYKTGGRHVNEGLVVGGGAVLQPMLYALALEELAGLPVEESRLWFCTERGGYVSVAVKPGLLQRHYARGVLEAIDASVAAGVLPPYPRAGACARCDFLEVCGSREEERVGRKRKHPALAPLDDIRSYP